MHNLELYISSADSKYDCFFNGKYLEFGESVSFMNGQHCLPYKRIVARVGTGKCCWMLWTRVSSHVMRVHGPQRCMPVAPLWCQYVAGIVLATPTKQSCNLCWRRVLDTLTMFSAEFLGWSIPHWFLHLWDSVWWSIFATFFRCWSAGSRHSMVSVAC